MNRHPISALTVLGVLVALTSLAHADPPAPGSTAPDFKLQDQEGRWHELKDYRGKWIVLYFCPKNPTPRCTEQAIQFRDNVAAFRELNAVILGISVDDVEAHKKFADKNHLTFAMLADPTKATATRYDMLRAYPGAGDLAKRDTLLIDPEGRVARHYPNVEPKGHVQAVLEDIKKLQQE